MGRRHTKAKHGGTCIELLPGEPVQLVPRLVSRLPPDNFINRNTYCYKLIDGQMRLRGIELGPGWENWPVTPGKLSCYHKKGERNMRKSTGRPRRGAPPKEELLALWEKHEGKINPIARDLETSWNYARKWLIGAEIIDSLGRTIEAEEQQTPPPNQTELGGTDPVQGEKEPAPDIIPNTEKGCPFDDPDFKPEREETENILYSVERIENIGKDIPPGIMPLDQYTMKEEFSLDSFKIRVLEIFQEVAATNQAPDYVTLAFIEAIINVSPGVD